MTDEHRDGKFWFGFFAGGLIGAVVLFFLGTKEGKKAGRLLEDKGKDLLGDLEDHLSELEKKGKELARQGEDIKDEVMETIEEKKEILTEGATEKLDTALAHIEKLQEQGLQTTSTLRKHIFKNIPKKSK
jgi:gas vesicle protein